MTEPIHIKPDLEYNSLREELNQSKKYVFERPLLIMGIGAVLSTKADLHYCTLLPMLMSGLLLFNYWFTVNRLTSACRIVAYIHVVMEGSGEWIGWESSLREYRKWCNDDREDKVKIVNKHHDKEGVPDNLMYYGAIFKLHCLLLALCCASAVYLTYLYNNTTNIAALFLTAIIAVFFIQNCLKWKPSVMRSLIERNILIWKYVLGVVPMPE